VPSLRSLVAAGNDVVLVVTQPDRPGHRLKLTPPAVKVAAEELGLEVFQPDRVRDPASVERLAALAPELIVVVAYGQIIPPSVLEIPRRGVVNVHASLLPRHRGAAPIQHAILAGDRETGVTIMRMDEQLDHGPILSARRTPIGEREDAASLTERLAVMGAELLVETLPAMDRLQRHEQDHAQATAAPRLRKEDGQLEWSMPAGEIDRRVRAFTPWPGATLPIGPERVRMKVLRGHPVAGHGTPGEILERRFPTVTVAAGEGAYELEEVQRPGRRPQPAAQLING
jgi:methionyl-tRNA formyltransferase